MRRTLEIWNSKQALKPLILPLQYFAEAGEGEGASEETSDEGSAEDKGKTYSQSELDAAISRAVDSHSKKKEKEFQKLLDKAMTEGVAKGKSYSQLTEEQRKEQDLSEREQKLLEKEQELTRKERLTEITADLQKEGMPVELAAHLVREDDNEKVKASILAIKKAWDAAINAKVKESLRQDDPKSGAGSSSKAKTLAERIAEEKNNQSKAQEYDPWAKK